MTKELEISLTTAKAKNKTLSQKIWEICWDRLVSCKYQSVVPKIDRFTLKRRRFLLKHTSSKIIRKIFRLKKSSHNLLPAHKSKYDLATPSNCLTFQTPFNEHHLLFECKNLQLLQNNLKTMITNTLSFHYHNSPRINLELFLGEGDTSSEAALEIRYLLCEFLNLPDIQDRILINPILA